jgi:hypothetical protein
MLEARNPGIEMEIRRWLRGLAWLLAGGVTLVILLYLVLLAINRSDESPSADVATLQKQLDAPPLADADNGYVYALGMAAAADQDPVEQGGKRRAFIAEIGPGDSDLRGVALAGERAGYRNARTEAITKLQQACTRGGEQCRRMLEDAPEVLETWLSSEAWLLERYRQLLQRGQWQETVPANPAALPTYQHLINAQDLYLLETWQQARGGNAGAVRDRLQQDLQFWRMVLRSSRTLFTRMIAVAAIERNLLTGTLALRALPVDLQAQAIAPAWRVPITREERGLYGAFAGEWYLGDAFARYAAQSGEASALAGIALFDRLSPRFFQPQATSNLSASSLLETARVFDVAELSQMPQVLEQRKAIEPPTLLTSLHPYNPVGHILIDVGKPAYTNYGPAAADLEGARRAALLAATLRAEGVTPADAAAAVRASPLTNPYTGAPLQWDADSASVVFIGLAEGERQRRSVPL